MASKLPRLRRDLLISRQATGSETVFIVKVPVTGRFFRLREAEHFIARQLDGATSLEALGQRFEERFHTPLPKESLGGFIERLRALGLLETAGEPCSPADDRGRVRGDLLYLRLKAVDPDRFLDCILRRLRWLFTPYFMVGSAALILLALGVLVTSGVELQLGLLSFTQLEFLVLAYLTLLCVTVVHEVAHGLTCKRFGGNVHELGFLLLYFQPAMYCNVSDAWLFPEKSRRLWVTFAGAYTELVLWAVATLLWRVTDPHTIPNHLALVVMTTSGIKTLFNLNPLLKLDGYFLLSDYLEIPNLRQKAFEYLCWRARRLWQPTAPGPRQTTARERRIYLIYGLLAGTFSCVFLGLVTVWVAGLLTSRLQGWGFILFLGLLVFVFRNPLGRALRRVFSPRGGESRMFGIKKLAILAVVLLPTLAVLFLGHMELRISGGFTIRPAHNADVRAEVAGIVEEVYVREGETVQAGHPIARLSNRGLRAEIEETRAERAEKQARHKVLVSGPRPGEVGLAKIETGKARERLKYARNELRRLQILYQQHLNSQRDLAAAEEEVAVRGKEVEKAEGNLRVLLAGSRLGEIEAIEAEIARLDAHHRYLEDQIQRLPLVSPHSGVVTTPRPEEKVGQYLEPGDLLVEVYELETVIAEIFISEKEISDVSVGQKVVLRARAFPQRSFEGIVTSIAPTATARDPIRAERTITVATQLENASLLLKPQMTGNARIYGGRRQIVDLLTRRLTRYLRVEFWSWW